MAEVGPVKCAYTTVDLYKNGLSFVTCIWNINSKKAIQTELILADILPGVISETLNIRTIDSPAASISVAEIYDTAPDGDNHIKCLRGKQVALSHANLTLTETSFDSLSPFAFIGTLEKFDSENVYIKDSGVWKTKEKFIHVIPKHTLNTFYRVGLVGNEYPKPSLSVLVHYSKPDVTQFKVEASYISSDMRFVYCHTLELNEEATYLSWGVNVTLYSKNNCDLVNTKIRLLNSTLIAPWNTSESGRESFLDDAPPSAHRRKVAALPKSYSQESRALPSEVYSAESEEQESSHSRGMDTPVELPFFHDISEGIFPKKIMVDRMESVSCNYMYRVSFDTMNSSSFSPAVRVLRVRPKNLSDKFVSRMLPGNLTALHRSKSGTLKAIGATDFNLNPYDYNIMELRFGADESVLVKRVTDITKDVANSTQREHHTMYVQNHKAEDVVLLIVDKFNSNSWSMAKNTSDNVQMQPLLSSKVSEPTKWNIGEATHLVRAHDNTTIKYTVEYKVNAEHV